MTLDPWRITGQSQIDSYVGSRVELAVLVVNLLAVTSAHGRQVRPPATGAERLAAINEETVTTGGTPRALTTTDADQLAGIAAELRPVFGAGDALADAAATLNDLLVRHAAVPNLHGSPDRPHTLAFHRADATRVDAWAADMGTALAMVVGVGQAARLGVCQADGCDLVFFDTTRNASRRFCDLSCQNRAKASAYRARTRQQATRRSARTTAEHPGPDTMER
ncbi:CGNR zinc finger domain-containing protein [Streptosporangium sp. CA-135522]|uniref:CGNR zinc finger domain-containing protein n=1 Tax=Streptosporangium sp. CA-135522 TaxID=3240072 RepID=UPI003D946BDB